MMKFVVSWFGMTTLIDCVTSDCMAGAAVAVIGLGRTWYWPAARGRPMFFGVGTHDRRET